MTFASAIVWKDKIPELGGKTDEDNLAIVLERIKDCKDERILVPLKDKFIRYLTSNPSTRIEMAAAQLIGYRFEFKDGPAFFSKDAVLNLYHRCDVFRYLFDRQKLGFPHLSKDSFSRLLEYYTKNVNWPFRTMLEVYMTFGNTVRLDMHHDLKEVISYYNPISVEDLAQCYDSLKKDPVIRLWVHLRINRNDNYYQAFVRSVAHYDEPILVTKSSRREDKDESVLIKDAHSGILVNTRHKKRVVFHCDFLFTEREAEMFCENNPKLAHLTLKNAARNVSFLLGPSIKSLTIEYSRLSDEDWDFIGRLKLEHLSVIYTKIPAKNLRNVLLKVKSFTYSGPKKLILDTKFPELEKLVLKGQDFEAVIQPAVKYLGLHGWYKLDQIMGYLNLFPGLSVLDLSLGHEVVNHLDVNFFVRLGSLSQPLSTLILRQREWQRGMKFEGTMQHLETVDISLSNFFEDANRVKKLKTICPRLKRIQYSHHETLNFRHVIDRLQEEHKDLAFEEIEVYPKELAF